MTSMGVIEGGWEFVWAAYGITALVLLCYGLSVHLRYRAERSLAEREAPEVAVKELPSPLRGGGTRDPQAASPYSAEAGSTPARALGEVNAAKDAEMRRGGR